MKILVVLSLLCAGALSHPLSDSEAQNPKELLQKVLDANPLDNDIGLDEKKFQPSNEQPISLDDENTFTETAEVPSEPPRKEETVVTAKVGSITFDPLIDGSDQRKPSADATPQTFQIEDLNESLAKDDVVTNNPEVDPTINEKNITAQPIQEINNKSNEELPLEESINVDNQATVDAGNIQEPEDEFIYNPVSIPDEGDFVQTPTEINDSEPFIKVPLEQQPITAEILNSDLSNADQIQGDDNVDPLGQENQDSNLETTRNENPIISPLDTLPMMPNLFEGIPTNEESSTTPFVEYPNYDTQDESQHYNAGNPFIENPLVNPIDTLPLEPDLIEGAQRDGFGSHREYPNYDYTDPMEELPRESDADSSRIDPMNNGDLNPFTDAQLGRDEVTPFNVVSDNSGYYNYREEPESNPAKLPVDAATEAKEEPSGIETMNGTQENNPLVPTTNENSVSETTETYTNMDEAINNYPYDHVSDIIDHQSNFGNVETSNIDDTFDNVPLVEIQDSFDQAQNTRYDPLANVDRHSSIFNYEQNPGTDEINTDDTYDSYDRFINNRKFNYFNPYAFYQSQFRDTSYQPEAQKQDKTATGRFSIPQRTLDDSQTADSSSYGIRSGAEYPQYVAQPNTAETKYTNDFETPQKEFAIENFKYFPREQGSFTFQNQPSYVKEDTTHSQQNKESTQSLVHPSYVEQTPISISVDDLARYPVENSPTDESRFWYGNYQRFPQYPSRSRYFEKPSRHNYAAPIIIIIDTPAESEPKQEKSNQTALETAQEDKPENPQTEEGISLASFPHNVDVPYAPSYHPALYFNSHRSRDQFYNKRGAYQYPSYNTDSIGDSYPYDPSTYSNDFSNYYGDDFSRYNRRGLLRNQGNLYSDYGNFNSFSNEQDYYRREPGRFSQRNFY